MATDSSSSHRGSGRWTGTTIRSASSPPRPRSGPEPTTSSWDGPSGKRPTRARRPRRSRTPSAPCSPTTASDVTRKRRRRTEVRSLPMLDAVHEEFTSEEREALAPFFTDLDGPVFCVVNLPEVVKGALFARYSRTAKTLRRLFLDEFLDQGAADLGRASAELSAAGVGVERAEKLYERVFSEYGDDSVAQLGGVHLAAEQASQILTKVLERGRLAAYLEQSTRYVPYDDKPGGRYRYHVPGEVERAGLGDPFRAACDLAFDTYARWLGPLQDLFRDRFPQDPADSDGVYRATIRAKACDTLRGILPAAARTHVGMYATAQSYESLLLRMRSHPLAEVRAYGDAMLTELRKVIPAFLTRVDKPDRGGAWSSYLAETRETIEREAAGLLGSEQPMPAEEVELTEFDSEGELKVVAAALYASTHLSDHQ